jgi:type IV pilus assembly protein PilN
MRITLNLATRPYTDIGPAIKRLRIAMAVLVVIGISLGLGLHAFHQKAEVARATEQSVQSKIDAINRERQGYQEMMRQPDNAQLLTQVKALNQLLDDKTFSWTLAMEDLEIVLPPGVQVTTLDPVRNKEGNTTLHLHVIGPRDRAVDLVRNLERSMHFVMPRIVGENFEVTGVPGEKLEPVSVSNRVNFEMLVDYVPNASTEARRPQVKVEQTPEKKVKEPADDNARRQLDSPVNSLQARADITSAIHLANRPSQYLNQKKTSPYANKGGQR